MHMFIAVGRAEDAFQKPVLSSSWETQVGGTDTIILPIKDVGRQKQCDTETPYDTVIPEHGGRTLCGLPLGFAHVQQEIQLARLQDQICSAVIVLEAQNLGLGVHTQ